MEQRGSGVRIPDVSFGVVGLNRSATGSEVPDASAVLQGLWLGGRHTVRQPAAVSHGQYRSGRHPHSSMF